MPFLSPLSSLGESLTSCKQIKKLTSWAQRNTTLQENITFLGLERKSLSSSDPEALWTKIRNLTALFYHKKELYASKELKKNAVASEGKS